MTPEEYREYLKSFSKGKKASPSTAPEPLKPKIQERQPDIQEKGKALPIPGVPNHSEIILDPDPAPGECTYDFSLPKADQKTRCRS